MQEHRINHVIWRIIKIGALVWLVLLSRQEKGYALNQKSNGQEAKEILEKKTEAALLMSGILDLFQRAASDPRLKSTIFAEGVGGSPEELEAITSVFLNRVRTQGLERALKGSTAFNTKSPQFQKAGKPQDFSPQESESFNGILKILNNLANNPDGVGRFTDFENVEAFGTPPFASKDFEDIGRQRFFFNEPDPVSNAAEIQRALSEKGFNPGPVDGFLGSQTKEAIKAFQSASGLAVDGIVGPNTQEVLFNAGK